MKPNVSVLQLIDKAYSDDARQAFRSQSAQLAAFAAVAVVYAMRTSWKPQANIDKKLRQELADISSLLNIDKIAHQTFIAHVRRMVSKLSASCNQCPEVAEIIASPDPETAHQNLLRYLGSRNVFTAGHMRTWATKNGYEPLELKQK